MANRIPAVAYVSVQSKKHGGVALGWKRCPFKPIKLTALGRVSCKWRRLRLIGAALTENLVPETMLQVLMNFGTPISIHKKSLQKKFRKRKRQDAQIMKGD